MFNIKNKFVPTPPYKKGFTLAEVLITLVIIGVIAAITVPTLITKYQKEQTVTRLKKAYSSLAQTTNRAIADYGPISTWDIGQQFNPDDALAFFNKYVVPYLNVMKKPTKSTEGNWDKQFYFLNGTPMLYDDTEIRFYLNDGTSVTAHLNPVNDETKRAVLRIDINGDKKPNKFGKDIFQFDYYIYSTENQNASGKFVPDWYFVERGELLSSGDWKCNKHNEGTACAAVIMHDGWRIADDYPW